jgi:uncharacterized damage-inducible protein DinB
LDQERQRNDLYARLTARRAGLLEGLLYLDKPTLTQRPLFDDWSVKDVLAHIAAWDRWEERTMRAIVAGEEPDFSAVRDFAVSNAAFVDAWRDRTLDDVVDELMAARADWVAWLKTLPDEELFRPRSYDGHDWTFSTVPMQVQWRHDAEHAKDVAAWREALGVEPTTGPKSLLLAALAAAREELLAAAALVPDGERASRPVVGVWTLKDVLGHIADWEFYGVEALRRMAAGQPPGPEPLGDIEAWNVSHAEARRDQPWEVAWDDLLAAREAFLAGLRGMDQAALARAYPFPWGEEGTPYQWMAIYIEHDREHARDVRGGEPAAE